MARQAFFLAAVFAVSTLAPATVFAQTASKGATDAGVPDPLAFGQDALGLTPVAPVYGKKGMVVSAQRLASEVGARILAEGGNAADAAVAVGYALAVVYPAAGNIGGGGFMVLHPAKGAPVFIDFREHAPLKATPTMYQDATGTVVPGLSVRGWKSIGVPGTVAGLELVRQRWGHMSREKLMAPAIKLARLGFVLADGDVQLLHTSTDVFRADPAARNIFLRPDGSPMQVGDRLVQIELADTLETIAKGGADAFYKGSIARKVVDASNANGGIFQMEDFAKYAPRVMPTLTCSYRGYTIETTPPPSGGGVALCEMLNILSGYDMHALGLHTAPAVQHEIEAMRHTYSDRRDLGDPAFVQNPVSHLIDPAYAVAVRQAMPTDVAIDSNTLIGGQAAPGSKVAPPAEGAAEKHETTQFSVMDSSGFAVSTTYTLNGWFGSGVIAGNTGFFLNDEMDDFTAKPGSPNMFGIVGGVANQVEPGKTPLSSMAPTILTRDGKPVMVIGSPGGSRIPTIILSVILGAVDYGLDIQQAIDLPRIHEQWLPQAVEIEKGALSDSVKETLSREGYVFHEHAAWGVPEGIIAGGPTLSGPRKSGFFGAPDRRHPGGAAVGE
ncbi:gamma-glutamyltransferase [Acetobacter sacchari]